MKMAFFDDQGNFQTTVDLERDNTYEYKKLVIETAEATKAEDEKSRLKGQIYKKLPGDYERGTRVYALDENGKIIDIAQLDETGKFKFTKLSQEANYMILLEENDRDVTFNVLDVEDKVVEEIKTEETAVGWEFKKLQHEKFLLSALEEEDSQLNTSKLAAATPAPKSVTEPKSVIDPKPLKPAFTGLQLASAIIYYDYRETSLTDDDKEKLDAIANKMLSDTGMYIRVNSFIDPKETLGETSYSAVRSVSVAKYLVDKGVPVEKFYVANMEDSLQAVKCPVNGDCTPEMRAKNQRTEIVVVPRSQMPTTPNYILYFDLNDWRIPSNAYVPLSGLIRVMKENPEYKLELSGYADVSGSFAANQRISDLRASNIKNYLGLKGLDKNRISVVAFGEMVPFGGCILEYPCPISERKQNRRLEIRILTK